VRLATRSNTGCAARAAAGSAAATTAAVTIDNLFTMDGMFEGTTERQRFARSLF
jgi:hypothetical protein